MTFLAMHVRKKLFALAAAQDPFQEKRQQDKLLINLYMTNQYNIMPFKGFTKCLLLPIVPVCSTCLHMAIIIAFLGLHQPLQTSIRF